MELSDAEIKERLVKLLCEFDRICKDNNLQYSLAYGTLIGAMRHKGFIPWDDDIDVIMPQDDYIKLLNLSCFADQHMDSPYILYEVDNSLMQNVGYMYPFAKFMDGKTYIISPYFREVGGLWIDIFPLTGLPNNEKKIKEHFDKMGKLHLQLAAAHRYRKLTECNPIVFLKQLRCNYYNMIHKTLVKKMKDDVFSIPYKNCDKVAVSIWNYGIKEMMPMEFFEDYIEVEFEGHKFAGLKRYDEYLTHLYGDWRKLPPAEQRVAHHHYKAYTKLRGKKE